MLIAKLEKNSFIVNADIVILEKSVPITFKIDTGCAISVIPYQTLFKCSKEKALEQKRIAIAENRHYLSGHGVSDSVEKRKRDKELIAEGRLEECTSLKFKYENCKLVFTKFTFSCNLHVNFDRDSNILLGMDILKKFDFHCGRSIKTKEYLFIGCLKSNITQEYIDALYEHFGIDYLGKLTKDTNNTAAALRNLYDSKDFT